MMNQSKEEMKPAFPGPIAGIPDIAVDNFTDTNKKAYFLSHFHSDHTVGLFKKPEFSRVNRVNVYMTKTTLELIKSFCYTSSMYDHILVKELITGKTYENINNLGFDVTLVPVAHIPGAVMFLFKSDGKKILYTGDFVIEKENLNQFKELHEEIGKELTPMTFDLVYYDDTYRKMKDTVPKRVACIEQATAITRDWLARGDDRRVVFHRLYDYGFEDLFTGICGSLRTDHLLDRPSLRQTIFLDGEKGQLLTYRQILKFEANVYTEDKKSKLRICVDKDKHCGRNVTCSTEDGNTLHFIIYTLNWSHEEPTNKISSNVWELCFPTHCSNDQLKDFFKYFKAQKRIAFSET